MSEGASVEIPQLEVNRPDKNTFRAQVHHESRPTPFGSSGRDPDSAYLDVRKYNEAVRVSEVDALQQISTDLSYEDGTIVTGVRTAVRDEITRLIAITKSIGDIPNLTDEQILEINKNWREVNYAATYDPQTKQLRLRNTLGNPEGTGELIHQELDIVPDLQNDKATLTLYQREGSLTGQIVMVVDYSEKEYENTHLAEHSGQFAQTSFSEATDILVSATNQAAYKFEVQSRKLETSINKLKPQVG